MLSIEDCHPLDEIFEHTPPNGGEVLFYNATAANSWAVRHRDEITEKRIAITKDFYEMVLRDRGVEAHKLERMTARYADLRILMVHLPDDSHLTIDGHHRVIWRYRRGMRWADAFVLTHEQSKMFLVDFTPLL